MASVSRWWRPVRDKPNFVDSPAGNLVTPDFDPGREPAVQNKANFPGKWRPGSSKPGVQEPLCETNPIAPNVRKWARAEKLAMELGGAKDAKQTQLEGRFQVGGGRWQEDRAQRHPPGPSRLRVGAAAPNEANSALRRAPGLARTGDQELFLYKRTQFGARTGHPNAIPGVGDPRSHYLGPSCETKPIGRGVSSLKSQVSGKQSPVSRGPQGLKPIHGTPCPGGGDSCETKPIGPAALGEGERAGVEEKRSVSGFPPPRE
jgi:hypothetical protein